MNFLFKIPKLKFIFLPAALLIWISSSSQSTQKEIFTSSPARILQPDYPKLSGKYHQVIHGQSGYVFVVCDNGILQYNGFNWSFITIPGICCLTMAEDQAIYAGGTDLFGTLTRDNTERMTFTRLAGKGHPPVPGTIKQLIPYREQLLAVTSTGLSSWDGTTFNSLLDDPFIRKAYRVQDSLFVHSDSMGLLIAADQAFERLLSPEQIAGRQLAGLMLYQDGLMAGFRGENRLFALVDNQLLPAEGRRQVSMPDGPLHKIKLLNGHSILCCSRDNDVAISCLETGSAKHHKFDAINDVRVDSGRTLWILHDHSISLVPACDPLTWLPHESGMHHPYLQEKQVMAPSFRDSSVTYLAGESGIALITGKRVSRKISGLDFCAPAKPISLAESADGYLWVQDNRLDLYRAELPENLHEPFALDVQLVSMQENMLQNSSFSLVSGHPGILLFHDRLLLAWDPGSAQFKEHPMQEQIRQGGLHLRLAAAGSGASTWLLTSQPDDRSLLLHRPAETGPSTAVDTFEYAGLDEKQVLALTEDPRYIYLSTAKGVLQMDKSYWHREKSFSRTFIRHIRFNSDSTLYPGVRTKDLPGFSTQSEYFTLPRAFKTISIKYLSNALGYDKRNLYQTYLAGSDEGWSGWTPNTSTELTGLKRGKYSFHVRSKDIYGMVGPATTFRFRIKPPLYASWWAFVIYSILILVGLYFYRKWRYFRQLNQQYALEELIQQRTETLMQEKEKTENLLANILPKKTAEELKAKGKATSSKFKMVTVLFSDIQGFTRIAEQMNPDKLIDQLDQFYFHFDSVVERYNIEKIKTIGDAYMAAGGIPVKNRTNPVEVVLAGLEMQHYMKELKKTNAEIWDLRIGIHTGSVIAGVVGQKKFSYDIWGDTVNTASRMESSGEPGRVNISEATHKLVERFFDCEYRGRMPVKYKGDIDMYFVNGLKEEYREDLSYKGNKKLKVQLQLLSLVDLEETVLKKIDEEAPEDLFFHTAAHTAHVSTQVELIGRSEGISDEEMLVLKAAALLHDVGYLEQYQEHEQHSIDIARELLPVYQFTEEQIDETCRLIRATSIPPKPEDLLEKIICDANLDHLGRVDFLILSDKLFQEYRSHNLIRSKKEWNEYQVDFLRKHEFFTDAARKLREVSKEDQVQNILQFS